MNSYNKTTWVNGSPPALNAAHLNKIEDALAEVIELANGNHDDIGKRVEYITAEAVDNATETGKIYHTSVGSSKALIIPVSGTLSQVQFRLDRDGKIYSRRRSRLTTESPFPAWGSWTDISAAVDPEVIREIVLQYLEEHGIDLTGVERTENRVDAINAQSDDEHYPTAGAVRNFVTTAIQTAIGSIETQLSQV